MKVIIDKRGSGKIKKLLEIAKNTEDAIILTQDKRALKVKAHSYGYDNLEIIDYQDLKDDNYPLGANVFIHNGDKVLYELLDIYYGLNVSGFTATMEEN